MNFIWYVKLDYLSELNDFLVKEKVIVNNMVVVNIEWWKWVWYSFGFE